MQPSGVFVYRHLFHKFDFCYFLANIFINCTSIEAIQNDGYFTFNCMFIYNNNIIKHLYNNYNIMIIIEDSRKDILGRFTQVKLDFYF